MNKVIIKGNLTRDPEKKALPSGVTITNFSVATNRKWKDKDGNQQEEVEFHNVVAFGKQAEVVATCFKKGSQIIVEGRLKTQSWDDKDSGKKMYRTEVMLETFHFCGEKPETTRPVAPEEKTKTDDAIEYPESDINPDDIPF